VLAPQPNKTRGLLEVELSLAHAVARHLLGGAGEAVALRPLTDIEEGVLTYVVLETLKALTRTSTRRCPSCGSKASARVSTRRVALLGDEPNLAVVQLRAQFGQHSGYVRLLFPDGARTATSGRRFGSAGQKRASDATGAREKAGWVKTMAAGRDRQLFEFRATNLARCASGDGCHRSLLGAARPRAKAHAQLKIGSGLTGYFESAVALDGGAVQGHRRRAEAGRRAARRRPRRGRGGRPARGSRGTEAGRGPEESTTLVALGGKRSVENNQKAQSCSTTFRST